MRSTLGRCNIALIALFAIFALFGFSYVYWRQKQQASQSDFNPKTDDTKPWYMPSTPQPGKDPEKPWYMAGGTIHPTITPPGAESRLWPGEQLPGDDRIINQLMFRPPVDSGSPLKTILVFDGIQSYNPWNVAGRSNFRSCPVNNCNMTFDRSEFRSAAAIVFWSHFIHPGHDKSDGQVWIMHISESPFHTVHVQDGVFFNMTSSYRTDSDIVQPYGKYVHYNSSVRQLSKPLKNYAANKTKQVAWFVSNCKDHNGREEYAQELQKYISVDIFGVCGTKTCPRSIEKECFKLLDEEYKFYLAFENSNCKDYITEKFFLNGLQHNVLPIVMGARPEDYKLRAPEHSYIHVDDFDSPQALAEYLLLLDQDEELYNSYFKWKGTGEFIEDYFWCRVCALLHDPSKPTKWYVDFDAWWFEPGICLPEYSNNSVLRWPLVK